jgi:hypothetical protein
MGSDLTTLTLTEATARLAERYPGAATADLWIGFNKETSALEVPGVILLAELTSWKHVADYYGHHPSDVISMVTGNVFDHATARAAARTTRHFLRVGAAFFIDGKEGSAEQRAREAAGLMTMYLPTSVTIINNRDPLEIHTELSLVTPAGRDALRALPRNLAA